MENKYPKLAIIGRPNVGKSTLFNRLIKERKSIVDDTAGVTRDKLYADIDWNGKGITLIDTGGLIQELSGQESEITDNVKKHIYQAIEEADFIIFLVDGKDGITAQDEKIASYLRKIKNQKKIFLAVNKIDTEKQFYLVHEFHSLGFGEPYPVSALSGSSGLADILDEVVATFVETFCQDISTTEIKIAIVGKPNVGKSSILNSLLGKERSIVTSISGTTRDNIDCKINIQGRDFVLIDTAGLRRKSKVSTTVERYATSRTISAIEKADIVLLVVDVTENISDQDQKIASVIKKRNKGSIIIANKWDLIKDKKSNTTSSYENDILTQLRLIDYSKILFTCAIENKNVNRIWDLVEEIYANYGRRISTGHLNKFLEETVLSTSMPSKKGKSLKLYYATQANIKPPEIVLFINDSELANEQYQRFLEKEIRKNFDFSGSPIKLVFRNKRA